MVWNVVLNRLLVLEIGKGFCKLVLLGGGFFGVFRFVVIIVWVVLRGVFVYGWVSIDLRVLVVVDLGDFFRYRLELVSVYFIV